ncbi:adenosine deaminase [Microbacterium betulae]|uniref:Adenosine deaminase n=1 Tax=Microbacterium betulae TaxID=2981139 RepID=A0AA97FEN5_9MICO|nr:adenosine deaminase [Microbacterium sp. AB]WOF22116.1 adenosine deaminase [Microbacterium sp. AB]
MTAVSAGLVSMPGIRSLPKAEVHVHLEGAIELADLLEAAAHTGVALPGPAATLFDTSTHEPSARPSGATPLSAFLRFLDWEGSLFSTPQQLARLAYRFAARQSASGISYTDVIVNPAHWASWRRRPAAFLDALGAGFADAAADGLCAVGICASILRTASSAEAEELVTTLLGERPQGLVGVSVDGDERVSGRTAPRFADAFGLARRGGLRRTVHAGESSGPEGVWDALTLLHAERIDHGVRAVEDPRLVDRLAADGVPVGVCPTSNIALGLYARLDEHPVDALARDGVTVTVNTDDPAALGTRIETEWLLCAQAFGWDDGRVVGLARDSFRASFAPDGVREEGLEALARRADAMGAGERER